MKVYIDLVLLLNFFFDFLLLLSVCVLLRRNVSIYRLMLGAFIGGMSLLFLFINVSSFALFLFKIIISIIMIIVSFDFKNIRYTFKNLLYFYSASMILGGFLYFLNVQFSYQQKGLIFFHHGLSINVIFLIIFCPFILYIYMKQGLWLKTHYQHYYKVDMTYRGKEYHFNGFLDTGNQLVDYITKKPIILIDRKLPTETFFYVPYKGVNNQGLLKCIKIEKIKIGKEQYENVIVGMLNEKIKIDGIDCLLNAKLWEGI